MADVDELFKLPLTEFTAARNGLAAKLKKSGDTEEADRVRALPKPPLSAWAVNQLYWRHRTPFDQLLAAGERFRNAQATQLAGKAADLRTPLEARREALSHLATLAAATLRGSGHPAGPDTMRHILTTLEALATYAGHADAPPAGRLTADVDPPGFEALAALVPRGRSGGPDPRTPPRVIPFNQPSREKHATHKVSPEEAARRRDAERRKKEADARKALLGAVRALRDATRAAGQARAAMKTAAAHAKETEKAKAAIQGRFEQASAAADAARQEARRVASRAEEAAQAMDDAERAVTRARQELKEI